MILRTIALSLVIAAALLVKNLGLGFYREACPALVLGIMLLGSYCLGFILEKRGLPRIVGYIFAGLLMGPFFLKLYTFAEIRNLNFINKLALAFIALCAGGELRLASIRKLLKSILYYMSGVTIVVFMGTSLAVFFLSTFIPFMADLAIPLRLAISCIFGTIAVARSPSSTIAIISETKAKGSYTDIVLSATIATDVFIIILFAIVISITQAIMLGSGGIKLSLVSSLSFEIAAAFLIGFLLGKFIVFLLDKAHVEFPVIIIAMGFIVIEFSHFFGDYLHEAHEIGLELEPLLVCMAAGFTVQNYSEHGQGFLERMDRVSMPIYIAFFSMTGASIDLHVLRTGWLLGLIVVAVRLISLYFGSYISGRLAKNEPILYKNTWLGFITQAGVSLGLLVEVGRRFSDLGPYIQTILTASIIINQVIGPVAFKAGLKKVGETNV